MDLVRTRNEALASSLRMSQRGGLSHSIVASQLAHEASVPATNPPAQLSVEKQDGGTVTISIQYWDAQTGISVSFSITA